MSEECWQNKTEYSIPKITIAITPLLFITPWGLIMFSSIDDDAFEYFALVNKWVSMVTYISSCKEKTLYWAYFFQPGSLPTSCT